jgi:hypothetical protein
MFKKMLKPSMGLIFFAYCSFANAVNLSTRQFELPFFPEKVGETYSFDVDIKSESKYSIQLRFYFTSPNKWYEFFDKEQDPRQAEHFYEILGGAKVVDGKRVEHGVPAKFRVRVIEKSNNKIILNKVAERPGTFAIGYGRYAILAETVIPKGIHTIQVEYVSGAPELATMKSNLLFTTAYSAK